MTYSNVENQVEMWGHARQIIRHGNVMSQAIKTLEECTELLDAINRKDDADITDAIGDIGVTLIMICAQRGVTFTKCLEAAYEQIKDRTGHMTPEGVFVKD